MHSREAREGDASAIAEIYNQGIDERIATFETEKRSPKDIREWFSGRHPTVVTESGGKIIAFARASPYSDRDCYRGVAEFSVYVHRDYRGLGAGKESMTKLIEEAELKGFWKLLSRVFLENVASRELLSGLGFREVGIYRKHARLDGVWKDVVIVEYLIEGNVTQSQGQE